MKELANACHVLINATNVKASFSLSLLKKIRFKYVAYALLICAIAGVVAWMVTCNPFKGGDDATVVDEDTLVSVNSPHNADTTVKVVTETPTIAPKDSTKATLVAKGVKKEKKEVAEKIEQTPIMFAASIASKKLKCVECLSILNPSITKCLSFPLLFFIKSKDSCGI